MSLSLLLNSSDVIYLRKKLRENYEILYQAFIGHVFFKVILYVTIAYSLQLTF